MKWNMLAERNKVQTKLQSFERQSMAQDDTLEKSKGVIEINGNTHY